MEDCKTLLGSSKLSWARERFSSKFIDSMALKKFHQPCTALSQPRRRVGTICQLTERDIWEDFNLQRPRCDKLCSPKLNFSYLIQIELHSTYMCVCAHTHTQTHVNYSYTRIINYTFLWIWQLALFSGTSNYNFILPKLKIISKINKYIYMGVWETGLLIIFIILYFYLKKHSNTMYSEPRLLVLGLL